MKFIKQAKWSYIGISSIMIILGIIFVIFPTLSALTICYIIGGFLMAFGIVKIVGYCSRDLFALAFQFDFALGIISLLLGILMIFHPSDVVNVFPVVVGVLTLSDGVFKIQTAHDAHKFGLKSWWSILVFAFLTCFIGLFLIINPFDGVKAMVILLGVSLIIEGLQNLYIVLYTVKTFRKEEKIDSMREVYDEYRQRRV